MPEHFVVARRSQLLALKRAEGAMKNYEGGEGPAPVNRDRPRRELLRAAAKSEIDINPFRRVS